MKKKTLLILAIGIVLTWSVTTPLEVRAGNPQRHRWEGVAIGVGAAIIGGALLHNHKRHVRGPRRHSHRAYYQACPPKHQVYATPSYSPPPPRGHWEWRKTWVPPVCEKTWNPGHYNRRNHWIPGRWIMIERQRGYWHKEKIWVSY